jgi:hypothetical protein
MIEIRFDKTKDEVALLIWFLVDHSVQSRAINFGRQGHSLTQSKMLRCKTVVNIITYHHVV